MRPGRRAAGGRVPGTGLGKPGAQPILDRKRRLSLQGRLDLAVERQIGDKTGTGKGTMGDRDGIRYLKTTLYSRAFPDLWSVRTVLAD